MPYKDKEAEKEYRKKYRQEHKEEQKAYYAKNKERINEYMKSWKKKNPEKQKRRQKKYNQSLLGRFNVSKRNAEKRNKVFNITFEEFCKVISEPCYYCNDKFNSKSITGSGLDREDNSRGYEVNNIKSCCKICNNIKGEFLTSEETKIAVQAIINFRDSIICD